MDAPPPPPPPHGANPQSSSAGLPPGNYDIFIIPPHSSGSGFLYLPSLQPSRNSFLAGFACALLTVGIWTVVAPILRQWFATLAASGGVGVFLLVVGVGIAGWAWGKTQVEAGNTTSDKGPGGPEPSHQHQRRPPPDEYPAGSGTGPQPQGTAQSPPKYETPPNYKSPPPPPPPPQPNGGYQSTRPQESGPSTPKPKSAEKASAGWEKAREETRKREEERRAQEELRRKREESEKQARAAAEKEKWEKMRAREKETREREARERIVRERLAKEKEAREKEAEKERLEALKKQSAAKEAKPQSFTARSFGVGEKTDPYARTASHSIPIPKRPPATAPSSPSKNYEKPSAQSTLDDDAYSFRPYDQPKRATKASSQSSFYSESSYAPSQSTARTTPPPSHRAPYSTKDPDKIVIKAVYLFNDLFPKPVAQLISGAGSVTDGLILRITTEGLFIDDDVRGVPQREWDVRAWTMKLVEVRCPQFVAQNSRNPSTLQKKDPIQKFISGGAGGGNKPSNLSGEEIDLILEKLLRACQSTCAVAAAAVPPQRASSNVSAPPQSGDNAGKHVLRASIRDADGKRYVFVIGEDEGWKVAVGLQRLRRGTQVRALGVSGLPAGETQKLLTGLGWA